jgi:hypothetical protein
MTQALQVALDAVAARIETAARHGVPLRTAQAVEFLRAAGIPRDAARQLVITAGDGRWTVRRGQTTARGGCPPQILLPVGTPVCEVIAAAKTHGEEDLKPVYLRARLLAAARARGFPRAEIRCQVIIPAGEHWWERFAAVADLTDVVSGLQALGVEPDAGESVP